MKQIAIDSPAVAHGLGLFETMLVVRGAIVLLDEHLARMTRSAAALGFPEPDADAFRRDALRVAESVNDEAALRVIYVASAANEWTLFAEVHAIPPLTLQRRDDARAITLDASLTRALPAHKMTSYASCVIGLRNAVASHANEGLFVRGEDVLEGTATNLFAVTQHSLITAHANVLPGVVRAWVLDRARVLGIAVEERAPSRDEVRGGAFLTGSLTGVAALREVDGERCETPGEIFRALSSDARALLLSRSPRDGFH
ncbi:MAG TPA: aminotransferase class IV [Thermoanaerobaculia bacterium]|nr:aminotransferase class IV [Thermoanaerobaculia bacterium]